ncbi:hypothetical protein LTR10_011531 [Elasticomyces elasticus]|uniref:MARVEL domain-containing protein n=1 Tax=Exophiala sideris TaxID=1016849 RepID=A0ABR0JCR1_9EURO|nr:hypothetical protein LTR10_011531 [Elasticomyces elasticus]KAK5032011.1 hypothetical protein LTS07_004633 [Exophiala sideris]KAK5040940.1 hypothetical protein LTR13_003242 [Exophiala sideris]KAK5061726.1 hypothetical protein LTR69_004908 [Exophiala sideris]KAK5184426.1 hypothetical protein LTR44_003099 [Eurotiomycetes sp. CCFEE 6388]
MSSSVDNNSQVVPMPRWSSVVGCARVLLAILVLGLTTAVTVIWGGYDEFIFALFTSSASLLVFIYYFLALSRSPALYNRWAVLGLEIFGVVFWLVSFLLLAHWTSVYNSYWLDENDTYGWWDASSAPNEIGFKKRGVFKRSSNRYHTGIALAGTAAGLGGVEFFLYTLTLIVFGASLHNQRVQTTIVETVAAPDAVPASEAETVGAEENSEAKTQAGVMEV